MRDRYQFRRWIIEEYNWARMALPSAVLALALLPIVSTAGNRPLVPLSTLLPVYMVHQYEKHAHGHFVAFFNATIGKGRDVLTAASAFWINILGVWLLFLASFSVARYVSFGVVLVPIYLTIFNGITHLAAGVALRGYNPGLYTSLLLFFPWGGFVLVD